MLNDAKRRKYAKNSDALCVGTCERKVLLEERRR